MTCRGFECFPRVPGTEPELMWHLHERGDLGEWLTRIVHHAWGTLGGYGYRTGRIALALLIVLLAAAGLGVTAGRIPTSPGRYVAMHTAQIDDPHGLSASPPPTTPGVPFGAGDAPTTGHGSWPGLGTGLEPAWRCRRLLTTSAVLGPLEAAACQAPLLNVGW